MFIYMWLEVLQHDSPLYLAHGWMILNGRAVGVKRIVAEMRECYSCLFVSIFYSWVLEMWNKNVSFAGAELALCIVKESTACVWGWLMFMMTSFIWQMEIQIQQLSNLITEHMNKWIYSHNPSKPVAFILFKALLSFMVEHSDTNNTEHKTQNHISN